MSPGGARWDVGLVATLALLAVGLLYADPTLLMAALVPLSYVVYGALSRVPPDPTVAVDRSISATGPEPGERVRVTLAVRNEGDAVLPDVRAIDGVPEELAVTEGSPRLCSPLSPGETASATYTVVATRGEFGFDEPALRLRSLAGDEQLTDRVAVEGDTQLACTTTASQAPVRNSTTNRQGTLPTDDGGSGLEFFATRQYKRGDPVNRIDWHHVAKTGEFVTVQYRTEQSVRAVLVVDARPVNRVAPAAGYPTGTALSAYAGERLYDALDDAGVATGVTAIGLDAGDLDGLVGPDGLPWVDPHHDTGSRGTAPLLFHRLQTALDSGGAPVSLEPPATLFAATGQNEAGPGAATVPGEPPAASAGAWNAPGGGRNWGPGSGTRADGGTGAQFEDDGAIRRLLSRLPGESQVLLCSPLLDGWPVTLAGALARQNHPLVVVSPDVTSAGTPGQRVAAVSRQFRLRAVRGAGAAAVDWSIDQPVNDALRLSLPHLLSEPGSRGGPRAGTSRGRHR